MTYFLYEQKVSKDTFKEREFRDSPLLKNPHPSDQRGSPDPLLEYPRICDKSQGQPVLGI